MRHSRFVVRAANSPRHSLGSAPRFARPIYPRQRRRPSSQAGSSDRDRALRLHAESVILRQRHSYACRLHRHALLDIGCHSVQLFCAVLLDRHAQRRSRASPASRCRVRRVCQVRAAVFPAAHARQALFRSSWCVFLCAVQEKPRISSRYRISAFARVAPLDVAVCAGAGAVLAECIRTRHEAVDFGFRPSGCGLDRPACRAHTAATAPQSHGTLLNLTSVSM